MKNTVTLIINNRCRISNTEASIIFATRCGQSKTFHIPLSQIKSRKPTEIKVNDTNSEPATEYKLTKWFYNKIEWELSRMNERNLIMPEK